MKIKATMRYHFVPSRLAIIKKMDRNNVDKNVERLELSFIANGYDACALENFLADLQKVTHRTNT